MWRDQDKGYSSNEDGNAEEVMHSAEQTPAMVIDAALSRLRARAGCHDSFVRQLSTSLLSRMARNLFRNWESARIAMEENEGTEMPDFIELVTEELRRFAQRSEIAEEYNRRNSSGSVELDELAEQRRRERVVRSPRRRLSHSRSMDDPTLDLDILQPVTFRSSPDSPISPTKGLTEDPEELRSFQRTEHVRRHRRHSKHLEGDAEREERRRLRRMRRSVEELESSQETDSQKSEEQRSQGAEGSVSPEESSTPSEELLASVEENPSGEAVLETGTKSKSSQKDKEKRRKRTRKVIEGFSNLQITSLRHLSITRMDAVELIIQLSVSMDRLDRLINGPRNGDTPEVNESVLAQFFSGLEISRTRETAHRVPAESSNERPPSSSTGIPKVTEEPVRDPRSEA